MIGYNRVCNLEDFQDPALKAVIREVFSHELAAYPADYPDGVADSKQWEIAMAVRTLRDHGCMTGQSRLLGVGAGTEMTSFFLANQVAQVVATDIYADAHVWSDVAPAAFLADPAAFSPIPFDTARLLPLHQDGRALDLPSDSFDGVYSSGSIEHFGSLEAVASAAYEIGRVLRPGGIASISTEFKLAGAPGSDGWDPNVILFSPDTLRRHVIEASGLEPVDAPVLTLSDATLSVRRDLQAFLEGVRGISDPALKIGHYPNLVLYHEGYLFCSVHLALRKPRDGPAAAGGDNAWAMPNATTRAAVRQARADAARHLAAKGSSTLREMMGVEPSTAKAEIATLQAELLAARQQAEAAATGLRAELHAARQQAEAVAAGLRAELLAARQATEAAALDASTLRASSSWRLTAPLRVVVTRLRPRD